MGLAALFVGAALATEPVELEAERIVLSPEALEATGSVRLRWGERWVEAESLRWDEVGAVLERPTSLVSGYLAGAERMVVSPEGVLRLEDAVLYGCGCAPSLWSVRASEVRATADGSGRSWLVQPRLLIGGVPVAWLPRLPLPEAPRRVSFGLPSVARGIDGLVVGVPIGWQGAIGPSLTLAPEWRQLRGPRVVLGAEDAPAGYALHGEAAWDTQKDRPRGAVGGTAGGAWGRWSAAGEGELISDADYLSDYSTAFLTRSTPWTVTRAQAGWGPLALSWLGWQQDGALEGVPSLLLRDRGRALGPLLLSEVARVDIFDGQLRAEGSAGAEALGHLGPLELSLEGQGRGWWAGAPAADGRVEGGVLLPLWADHGAARHELSFGALAGAGGGVGEDPAWVTQLGASWSDPGQVAWGGVAPGLSPGLSLTPNGAWAGPAISSIWWGSRRSLALEARGLMGSQGLAGAARLQADAGPLAVNVDGLLREHAHLLSAVGRYDARWVGLRLGLRSAGGLPGVQEGVQEDGQEGLQQGNAGLTLHIPTKGGTLSPGAELLARPDAVAAWSTELGWEADGGCMSLGARVGFAEDREGPQIAVWFSLRAVKPEVWGPPAR